MDEKNASEGTVRLEWRTDGVAHLVLNRADEHNTLTYPLLDAIAAAVNDARAGDARALIVSGTGRVFCGGANIKYFVGQDAPLAHKALAIRDEYVREIIRVFRLFRDSPFVSIAAINGHALGGGCELALHCDFRVMSTDARIGLTEARLGAIPGGGGVQLLARLVGRARAREIALLADQLSAPDALAAGLVNSIHSHAELDDAALALARRALRCSPASISEIKRALDRCESASADEADEIALDGVAAVAAGPQWWEGMAAFVEKRPARFVQT